MNKIIAIIPAYNEAESIEKVIMNLKKYGEGAIDYVVVNDGSKDNTTEICKNNKFNYIDLPINLGLAGAVQAGMKYAYRNGYNYAIQFDGDGQHNAEYIIPMVKYADEQDLDLVIGSRFVNKKKNRSLRMLGNSIIEFCIRLTTGGAVIRDSTSGMRLYNRRLIEIQASNNGYGPEPDTVAFFIRCGAKFGEYPVHMNDRETGESYLNISNSIKYMFHMCVSILVVQWFRKKVKICHFG